MLKSRAAVLAKLEGAYGVDAVPVAATDAIFCEEPTLESVTRKIERNHAQGYYGSKLPINIGEALKISFKTEVAGSGSAVDTPPMIGRLFQACNFTETISAAVSVAYDPNSADTDGSSLTIYFYQDGRLHKAVGCRGASIGLETKAGELGKLSWEFQGLYAGPADIAFPVPIFSQPKPERFVSAAFSIDAYAAVIENLKINVANEIVKRADANAATGILEYFIKGRKITGEIDPEAVLLATKDFDAMWQDSTQVAFAAQIGQTSTNRCKITGPKVSIDDLKDGDREGLLTQTMPIRFVPDSGNDEIQFLFD